MILRPNEKVLDLFIEFMWPTILLVGTATIFSTIFGIAMGIYAGGTRREVRQGLDVRLAGAVLDAGVLAGHADDPALLRHVALVPEFGPHRRPVRLHGFAAVGDVVNHLFLPCLTLTLAYLGEYYLVMRSSLLDVLGEDYITTARAKGVREKWVLRRHAVRNALLPTITLIALSFGFVLGGADHDRVRLRLQGTGGLTYDALQARDYPLLQGVFLIASAIVILFNLIADLIYGYFDPRVREA